MLQILIIGLVSSFLTAGTIHADQEMGIHQLENRAVVERPAIHDDLVNALSYQLRLELESAYLYLGMSTYFAENNLEGFSKWFSIHSQEELSHAMKVYQFLLDRGIPIIFPELPAPKTKWESPTAVFEEALAHEILVSQAIHSEYSIAQELKHYDVVEFLLWFVKEQVEEESLFESVLSKLYMIQGADPIAMLLLDRELGKRKE